MCCSNVNCPNAIDAALWREHIASGGKEHTHRCIRCQYEYTPLEGQSEDCPVCGCDGTP